MPLSESRQAVVDEARSWIGTPFANQAHRKGVGVDCLGLIGGVAIGVGAYPPESWQTIWAQYEGYAASPANGVLLEVCRRYMRAIDRDAAQAGDIVLIKFDDEPQHMAIFAPYVHGGLSMIHAYSRAQPARVVEHRLSSVWWAKVTHAFVLPGVT